MQISRQIPQFGTVIGTKARLPQPLTERLREISRSRLLSGGGHQLVDVSKAAPRDVQQTVTALVQAGYPVVYLPKGEETVKTSRLVSAALDANG